MDDIYRVVLKNKNGIGWKNLFETVQLNDAMWQNVVNDLQQE